MSVFAATPHRSRVVVRARIVLLAARGMTNVVIADLLGVDADTVSKWRKRFVMEGLAGLRDRQRSGRPRTFAGEVVAEVKAAGDLDGGRGGFAGDRANRRR